MRFLLIKCVFFFIAAIAGFSQNDDGGQTATEPYWRQALGGEVLSMPSYQAQSAVVALDGGNIRAYSTNGTPMWNFFAGGRISPYVTRSREGTSYFSRTNGTLIVLNRAGRELWRRSLDAPLCAGIVFGWDGRLFVPTNGKIYCYTASGNLLWTKTIESSFLTNPKADTGGGIIYSLNNNNAYRVDPYGNTHVWALSKTPAVLLSMKHNAGLPNNITVLYTDGTMEVLGESENRYFSALPASPIAAVNYEDKIAVTMSDGRIALVSMDERKILWTGDSHIQEIIKTNRNPALEAEMQFDENGIYVLSKDGASGFLHDGRRLWYTFLNNAAAAPVFGNDGVLYSGGSDWILYAYKIENRTMPESDDLYGPAPDGSYGLGRPRSFDIFDYYLTDQEIRTRLDQISAAINAGAVGVHEPAWTSFLLTLSAGNQTMQHRVRALDMLGKLGSQETIPWLINLFRNDKEPVIKTAAINAIGNIGVDPQGIALQAFMFSVINSQTRDDLVLTAIASATGALCRFSGPPLSTTGIRILTMLTARNQPPYTRRQAERELASLM